MFRRVRGCPPPWTDDPVLRRHRFTNAYRAADRVSQYLIANVIYKGRSTPEEVVFRIMLFKLFNKIETWELLENHLGELTWKNYSRSKYSRVLSGARAAKKRIYSAAYIMPSGGASFGFQEKHRNHLALIEYMMKNSLAKRIGRAATLSAVYEILRSYPTLGPFLAFQFTIDINYSPIFDDDEMSFVVPGPGARDGIAKCFKDRGGLSDVDLIKLMADRQEHEFEKRRLQFECLGDRRLQLIDCQNLFCEVDKYARVMHPDVKGLTKRTRIKQVFKAKSTPVDLWFPPKWGINDMVREQIQKRSASP